jgi:hypothetical protein
LHHEKPAVNVKLALSNWGGIPYGGGYRLKDPLSGVEVYGTTFNMFLNRMRDQRRANSFPIGLEFEQEMEQLICQHWPQECTNIDVDKIRPRNLGLHDVMVGTSVMARFVISGMKVVPQEEAERRASICVNCAYNTRYAKPCNGVCAELLTLIRSIVGQVGTSKDADLHACQVCACSLPAAVYVPLDIQLKPLSDNQIKQFESVNRMRGCWKVPPNDLPQKERQ